ncbi:MAG TPA: sugar ABC transporter permease [Clostridiales bacterium]|nr:sugar ABC transporter permease [Clostridiales bacterium]
MKTQCRRKYTIFHDIIRNRASYLMGLPAILYALIFGYFTYPYMIIAFQKFNYRTGLLNSEFVGFKNFEFFFRSSQVFTITLNTIWLNLLFITFTTLAALALALMFNELRNRYFIRINQAMIMFPNYLSWVVVSFMIYSLFSTNYGLINQILSVLGSKPIAWYNNADYWPAILTIMRVWKGAGINSVIYMATIAGIDSTYVEAAVIDGAKRWQICRYITLPLLMPTVSILTLLSIGGILYGDFGMIYAIVGDNGILLRTTDVIDTYVFRALRRIGDPSNAMAIGLFQSLVGFIMVYGSNALAKKLNPDAALY